MYNKKSMLQVWQQKIIIFPCYRNLKLFNGNAKSIFKKIAHYNIKNSKIVSQKYMSIYK